MADNTVLSSGVGGDTIATDDIAGVKHQRVKVEFGVDGSATDVSTSNPLPIGDAGGSLTVDGAVAATQSGSWILAANSGVDVGDVTVNNAAGASAVNVQDGGNSLTVDGTVTANAGTGPWPVTDNGGSLTVDGTVSVSGSVAVTNGGTFAVQDSQKVADNAAFTDGTTPLQPVGFVFDEVAGTALTENDVAAARVNVNRTQVQTLEDGVTRGRYATVSAANALKVDGSGVTQPVSGTVTANPASGTITTVTTVGTLTGAGVAHDGVDSGNPHKVGAKAGTADQAAVAAGDRTDLRADVLGHLVVRPFSLHENLVSGGTVGTPLTTTTSASMIASAGAGVRNYVTALTVTNGHASVGTVVQIRDGSAGTVLWEGFCAAAGGGAAVSLPTPLRGSAATAVHAVCVTTGASVSVSVSGYKSAV